VHISQETVDEVKKKGFDVHVIPGGCTGLMQPLDTCINKPLKDKLKVLYNSWLADKALNIDTDRIYPPPYDHIIDWVLSSLNSLDPSLIMKSFKHCGKKKFDFTTLN
jgi:hypothetical protein